MGRFFIIPLAGVDIPLSIKVLCEQTREANKRIIFFFGLCLILFGFGNIVADFHV